MLEAAEGHPRGIAGVAGRPAAAVPSDRELIELSCACVPNVGHQIALFSKWRPESRRPLWNDESRWPCARDGGSGHVRTSDPEKP